VLNFTPVLRVLGGLLLAFAGAMLIPLLYEFEPLSAPGSLFLMSMMATAFVGGALMAIAPKTAAIELNLRQGFLVTALSWLILPAFGGLPLMGIGLSPTDAYFEAVSGLTTTGSTVMNGLDQMARPILLWRSVMQAFGAVGIIVVGIIMMPFLRVGGMQLFQTESSDRSEKIVSRSFDLSLWIIGIYLAFMFVCAFAFAAAGMGWFDAFNHAITAIGTGGFSTYDASFGHFASYRNADALLWIAIIAMLAGSMPFVAYIRIAKGNPGALFSDIQVRAFLLFLTAAVMLVTLTRVFSDNVNFANAFKHAVFNVVSVVSTTGFASEDYQSWGAFAVSAFFVLTFVGGCSGSTAGGIKIYRLQILWRLALAHLSKMVSPNRVHVVRYGERKVESDVAYSILAFLVVLLFTVTASTIALAWLGLDFVTALTSSAQAVSNVGPGLGAIVGPVGNYSSLPDAAKWILSFAMIVGRLEYFTIFVLLVPAFWRA
jgi:trk system potassium uptake protein TrkH